MRDATARIRYTAADRRAAEAARVARLEQLDRDAAALTFEAYLEREREVAIVDADTLPWYVARHAELVTRYGAGR